MNIILNYVYYAADLTNFLTSYREYRENRSLSSKHSAVQYVIYWIMDDSGEEEKSQNGTHFIILPCHLSYNLIQFFN